jgi:hypothetical protein
MWLLTLGVALVGNGWTGGILALGFLIVTTLGVILWDHFRHPPGPSGPGGGDDRD